MCSRVCQRFKETGQSILCVLLCQRMFSGKLLQTSCVLMSSCDLKKQGTAFCVCFCVSECFQERCHRRNVCLCVSLRFKGTGHSILCVPVFSGKTLQTSCVFASDLRRKAAIAICVWRLQVLK
jgi:hypothetical protein